MKTLMAMVVVLVGCVGGAEDTIECGPGTHLEDGVCVVGDAPDAAADGDADSDADADADADSDADADGDSDADADVVPDSNNGTSCDTDAGCNDGNPCTSDACAAGFCTYLPDNDLDNDGFDGLDCGGLDCNDSSNDIHPGATDLAGDLVDMNCDGEDGDPTDPNGTVWCQENGVQPEMSDADCRDSIDNDCDGLTDCHDPDCSQTAHCCVAENGCV